MELFEASHRVCFQFQNTVALLSYRAFLAEMISSSFSHTGPGCSKLTMWLVNVSLNF